MNINTNRQAYLALSHFSKLGPQTVNKLEKYFNSAIQVFYASRTELEQAGLNSKLASEYISWRNNYSLVATETALEREGVNYITKIDASYPLILREIHASPYILYFRGNISLLSKNNYQALAVIGSRNHSAYGAKIISMLLPEIINQEIIIVSGLAIGVDTLAHQATLMNQGKTIAVLGSGLNDEHVYPPSNRSLLKAIIEKGGLILSEFPPFTPPLKGNFPQRNRIISGLSQAILVIEAGIKSGALITANYALEQNREVLAVPGNTFSDYSRGTNHLLKLGAKLVDCPTDILEMYNCEHSLLPKNCSKATNKIQLKAPEEEAIYNMIKSAHERGETITSDEIADRSQLDTAVINSTLSILELGGVAKYDGIGYDIN